MTQRNNKQKFYVDIAAVHPEVTGSSILCIVKNTDPKVKTIKFLVDCGLFQEEYGTLNETLPFNSQELDFVSPRFASRFTRYCESRQRPENDTHIAP